MKISPIIKNNQNKININQNYKPINNSNIISKTKQAYNKITVKSAVPQNNLETEVKNESNSQTQKQIIDIASQKLIKIVKNMTEAEIARKTIKYANKRIIRLIPKFLLILILFLCLNSNKQILFVTRHTMYQTSNIKKKLARTVKTKSLSEALQRSTNTHIYSNCIQVRMPTMQVAYMTWFARVSPECQYHEKTVIAEKKHAMILEDEFVENENAVQVPVIATTSFLAKFDPNVARLGIINSLVSYNNIQNKVQLAAIRTNDVYWEHKKVMAYLVMCIRFTKTEEDNWRKVKAGDPNFVVHYSLKLDAGTKPLLITGFVPPSEEQTASELSNNSEKKDKIQDDINE